jgi:prepilin-type N-terminal cleavage/methylation domain-containing protein
MQKVLRNTHCGFTLIELVATVALIGWLAALGMQEYQKGRVKELLTEKTPAAYSAALDRVGSFDRIGRLAAEATDTNAPGHYRKVVYIWQKFTKTPTATYMTDSEKQWLISIKERESAEVVKYLTSIGISTDELDVLGAKLENISPALTDEETAKLKKLVEYGAIADLSRFHEASLVMIIHNLETLGASKSALRDNGIRLPEKI